MCRLTKKKKKQTKKKKKKKKNNNKKTKNKTKQKTTTNKQTHKKENIKKQDQKRNKDKNAQTVKSFRKNPEAVKRISGKRIIVYCCCICHLHTLVFGIRKAWPPPIGTLEIDGMPKASMVELLVTKQDPNSCDLGG